jgi:hypothetical protein
MRAASTAGFARGGDAVASDGDSPENEVPINQSTEMGASL